MELKKYLIKILKPRETEEVKPNLFIQQTNRLNDSLIDRLDKTVKGHEKEIQYPKYRMIFPASWNNKLNIKNLILGGYPLKSTIIFLFILFMAWAYQHDINSQRDLVINLVSNSTLKNLYCSNISISDPLIKICNNINLNLNFTLP